MTTWDVAAQGTDGWLRARCGFLTASRMAAAMAFDSKGKPKEARRKLIVEVITERLKDAAENHYVTPAMQWGLDYEQEAKDRYEEVSGTFITPCGFAMHDTITFFGASPDGLLGKEGLIEVKCPTSATHVGWLLEGVVPEKHKPQMLAQMAVTGRKWCDFVTYDPRMPEKQQIMVVRFTPPPEEIKAVEAAAETFLKEVDEMWEELIRRDLL